MIGAARITGMSPWPSTPCGRVRRLRGEARDAPHRRRRAADQSRGPNRSVSCRPACSERSWPHFRHKRARSWRAAGWGQITFIRTYWFQNYLRGRDMRKPDRRRQRLDWRKCFSAPRPTSHSIPSDMYNWRWFIRRISAAARSRICSCTGWTWRIGAHAKRYARLTRKRWSGK